MKKKYSQTQIIQEFHVDAPYKQVVAWCKRTKHQIPTRRHFNRVMAAKRVAAKRAQKRVVTVTPSTAKTVTLTRGQHERKAKLRVVANDKQEQAFLDVASKIGSTRTLELIDAVTTLESVAISLKDQKSFAAALVNPPKANVALRKAFKRHKELKL